MQKKNIDKYQCCRVCGLYQGMFPWGEDGEGPSHDICACCETEFGYEDGNIRAIQAQRKRWLDGGGDWRHKKEKPAHWSLEEQMKNIPEEFL